MLKMCHPVNQNAAIQHENVFPSELLLAYYVINYSKLLTPPPL